MSEHSKHIVLILLRRQTDAGVAFLLHPNPKWHTHDGPTFLALPSKMTVDDEPEPFERGISLEAFVDATMRDPEFIKEAARLSMQLRPQTGAKVTALTAQVNDTPKAVLEKTAKVLGW